MPCACGGGGEGRDSGDKGEEEPLGKPPSRVGAEVSWPARVPRQISTGWQLTGQSADWKSEVRGQHGRLVVRASSWPVDGPTGSSLGLALAHSCGGRVGSLEPSASSRKGTTPSGAPVFTTSSDPALVLGATRTSSPSRGVCVCSLTLWWGLKKAHGRERAQGGHVQHLLL